MLTPAEWQDYANVINEFMQNDSAKKPIVWRRFLYNLDRYREDSKDKNTQDIILDVLLNYNYFRTWPITFTTESGELDRQSIQILINKDYLKTLGYLTPSNNFDFNPDKDLFIIDGKPHRAMGDTSVSQASSLDLIISIIVKREELETSDPYSP